jgi:phenylacetate-coenzyme A ligase PaaK-like adenylate-forming protein
VLLAHAVERSPYYRELLGADAAERPLAELPTLPKATFVEQWDRVVCDPRLTLAGLEAHAAGAHAAEPYQGEFRVVSTSGATGLRGFFVYGEDDWRAWVAASLRGMARAGIGAETRLATIGAPSPVHMSKQLFAVLAGDVGPRRWPATPE